MWNIWETTENWENEAISSGLVSRRLYFKKKKDFKRPFFPPCRNWPICHSNCTASEKKQSWITFYTHLLLITSIMLHQKSLLIDIEFWIWTVWLGLLVFHFLKNDIQTERYTPINVKLWFIWTDVNWCSIGPFRTLQ